MKQLRNYIHNLFFFHFSGELVKVVGFFFIIIYVAAQL